jgi:hypothetical protein
MNAPISDLRSACDDLLRLLAVVADPAKHKARVDELIAREAAAKASIVELHAMEGETRRLHNTARATDIVSNNRAAALDAREAEIEDRASRLELSESTKSDASLRRREAMVESRENACKTESDRLAAMRRDLEGRLIKIKNLTNSLER